MSLLCGAAEVDITPNIGLPMAGYSSEGAESVGVAGHLFVRVLYLEDDSGGKAAFCIADLHSGTRYLLEKAANLAKGSGVRLEHIVLCGTHTHTGPGNIYGNSVYDTFAQKRSGLDPRLADWLARRISEAIKAAVANKEPALVGVGREPLWGMSRNRSYKAFMNNPGGWNSGTSPGANAPPLSVITKEQRKVDPRITVLGAFREADRAPLGLFGTFGCHTTTLGPDAEYYAPDWAGYAVSKARWEFEQRWPGHEVVVGMALGGAGDVNGLRDELEPSMDQGPWLARKVGLHVGVAMAKAARKARKVANSVTVVSRYREPTIAAGAAYPNSKARLADTWMLGVAGMAGAEDGRTSWYHRGLAFEETTGNTPAPQRPKKKAAGELQDWLRDLLDLETGTAFPLHAITIGNDVFVTVPGEPTAYAAFEIERAVRNALGCDTVTVIGYAGDYFGYFTTPKEYDQQHYEGGSTLYGRYSARHIQHRLLELVGAPPLPPSANRPDFSGVDTRNSVFRSPKLIRCKKVPFLDPCVERDGNLVHVRWNMDWFDRPPFALDWLIRVETRESGSWQPFQYRGRDLDDRYGFIRIERDPRGKYSRPARWHAWIHLPRGADAQAPLRVRVNKVHEFQGFKKEIE